MHNMVVEVFKTNVRQAPHANKLVSILLHHFPGSRINFDLDDCDNVLRVEGENIKADKVITVVEENGFNCDVLE